MQKFFWTPPQTFPRLSPDRSKHETEKHGCQVVRQFFEGRGYFLQHQSWRIKDGAGKKIFGLGEIDLYMVQPSKNLALLIEVKSRSRAAEGEALILEKQLLRLRRSRNYLQRCHPGLTFHLVLAYVQVTDGQLEFLWNP